MSRSELENIACSNHQCLRTCGLKQFFPTGNHWLLQPTKLMIIISLNWVILYAFLCVCVCVCVHVCVHQYNTVYSGITHRHNYYVLLTAMRTVLILPKHRINSRSLPTVLTSSTSSFVNFPPCLLLARSRRGGGS